MTAPPTKRTGVRRAAASQRKWKCDAALEGELRSRGFRHIAGTDEVGRGSLFGPVVAAAVILSPDSPIRGLNDSKQIDPETREVLAERIRERAVAWAVASVDAATIDRINIYQASRLAMKKAISQLSPAPDFLLADAISIDLPIPQQAIIKGDERCHAIAAASIIAKVHRDNLLREWDRFYPEYGLGNHKGYHSPEHLAAIQTHGPSPLHRMSYEPVRQNLAGSPLEPQTSLFQGQQLDMFAE